MENILSASIYVGTYSKYNEGSLFGEWIELSQFESKDKFIEYCLALHSDEQDPELMFQDYEYIPKNMVSESWLDEKVFDIINYAKNLDETTLEALSVYLDNFGTFESFEDNYIGYYESEYDFAYELVEQDNDLSEFALRYFDYDAYARDLFINDYDYYNGYVFSSH